METLKVSHKWSTIFSIIVLVLLIRSKSTCGTNPNNSETEKPRRAPRLLDMILNDEYDSRFRPNYGKAAVDVKVSAAIMSMPQLDSSKQELVMNLFLKQTWNDSRLKFEGYDQFIKLDSNHAARLWVPDTFIVNEVAASAHGITLPNYFVKISSQGVVYNSARYTVKTTCPMHFQYFPFDEQTCYVAFESYCCTGEDIRYKWAKGNESLSFMEEKSHKEFKIIGHRTKTGFTSFSEAGYSRLVIELLFRRSPGRYLIEFFYPCIFLSMLSLAALFVADPRMSVLINVLTMGFTVLFLAVSSGALEGPFISYSTALDTFSSITNTIVFMSLSISILALHFSKNNYGPELIKLSDFGKSNGRVRFENQEDDEDNLCSNSADQEQPGQQQQAQSTRAAITVSLCGGLCSRFLPSLKLCLVLIYVITNMIFWTTIPYAQQTHNDALLNDDWKLL